MDLSTGPLEEAADATRPTTATADRPVALAVVTSTRGVLIGRRVDGAPPWTFPGGKIEPGESPDAAAIREVAEEAGLAVAVTVPEIGRRVHPASGRTVIYVGCRPTGALDVVPAVRELAELRWADLVTVTVLLPGLFNLVLDHLRHEMKTAE